MRILGIDPGTAITGYSILDYDGNNYSLIECGVITTKAKTPLSQRLSLIYSSLQEIIQKFKPEHCAVEQLFFNTNATTALAVGHSRGIVLLAAEQNQVEIFEYTPLQVKQGVTGYGRAEKKQVQEMVRMILNLEKIIKPDDAADAAAIAICHAHSYRVNRLETVL